MANKHFESASELVCYITALMCGISMLLPVNAVFSAPLYIMNYYQYVMKDPDAVAEHTNFWDNSMTYYILVCLVVSLVVEPLTLTAKFRRIPLQLRMLSALVFLWFEIILLMVVPAAGSTEGGAIATLVVAGFISGGGKSVFESTTYGMFSQFPPRYMAALMGGAGVAGALTSTIQLIIKGALDEDYEGIKKQSQIFYGLMVGIQGVTFVMLVLLRWNSFAAKYMQNYSTGKKEDQNAELDKDNSTYPALPDNHSASMPDNEIVNVPENAPENVPENEPENVTRDEGENESQISESALLANTDVFFVFKTVYPMALACAFNFFITLMLFPQLVVSVDPDDYWYGTVAVFIFNVMDVFGRFAPSFKFFWPPRWSVYAGSIGRVVFVPLIVLASFGYIPTHAFGYAMMVIFGLTNGYVGALTLIYGPITEGITTTGQRFVAGTMLGISILVGGTFGTSLSILIQSVRTDQD